MFSVGEATIRKVQHRRSEPDQGYLPVDKNLKEGSDHRKHTHNNQMGEGIIPKFSKDPSLVALYERLRYFIGNIPEKSKVQETISPSGLPGSIRNFVNRSRKC